MRLRHLGRQIVLQIWLLGWTDCWVLWSWSDSGSPLWGQLWGCKMYVLSTYLFQKQRGGERSLSSSLDLFHYEIGYHCRNWGTHTYAMDLLIHNKWRKWHSCKNSSTLMISSVVSALRLVRKVLSKRCCQASWGLSEPWRKGKQHRRKFEICHNECYVGIWIW